ncbi:hypothetical protein S83_043961, partial [Arachis hypogaea]
SIAGEFLDRSDSRGLRTERVFMNMDQQYGWVRDTATVEFHSAGNGTRIANTAQFMKIYSRE